MSRAWLALAVLLCGAAQGAAPAYTAGGIVNASNYSGGPFAPNSVLSIFGSELARSAQALTAGDIRNDSLPTELNSTQVFVDNIPAPLFYVSETQINFLVHGRQSPGEVKIQVIRQGSPGPEVKIPVVDAAPALFTLPNGYVIATHADNTLITPESPARGGEAIVIWATGLGRTTNDPASGKIPVALAEIVSRAGLRLSIDGRIIYAGLSPGSVGLYQINVELPPNPGIDPELRVTIGSVTSAAGVKLAVR